DEDSLLKAVATDDIDHSSRGGDFLSPLASLIEVVKHLRPITVEANLVTRHALEPIPSPVGPATKVNAIEGREVPVREAEPRRRLLVSMITAAVFICWTAGGCGSAGPSPDEIPDRDVAIVHNTTPDGEEISLEELHHAVAQAATEP